MVGSVGKRVKRRAFKCMTTRLAQCKCSTTKYAPKRIGVTYKVAAEGPLMFGSIRAYGDVP